MIRVRLPLPLSVPAAFVVYARAQATLRRRTGQLWFRFAIGLELGFFGLLRPGEICGLLAADIALPDSWVFAARGAVLRIEAPKNRRHLSRHQFVLIELSLVAMPRLPRSRPCVPLTGSGRGALRDFVHSSAK